MGKFFIPAYAAPALAPPVSMPVALPAVKIIFPIAPEKPPLPQEAALKFLNTLDFGALKQLTSLVNHQDSQIAAVPFSFPIVNFSKRPLQRLPFSARAGVHHSLILQIDGLLFAVFRQRLERDVCALSKHDAFCVQFGTGASPASTFCGLFMPPPLLLNAIILAVKHERGYGVFVGPVLCDAWATLGPSKILLSFLFAGPNNTPWQGIFASFAYQSRIKRKKQDTSFVIETLTHEHIPRVVGIIPFCPARISTLPFFPKAGDDTARRSPPLDLASGIPKPTQSVIWNAGVMATLSKLFPHQDVADLFNQAVSPSGASLLFVGDRTKRVAVANGELDANMLRQIRERFVSEVSLNRMMGPFDRCPFPNEWNGHQARNTPLDTRRKDKYDPLSQRFRVISNFSAGRSASINNLIYSPRLISTHLQCAYLRDTLFSMGPQAIFNAIDQQDAFRADHIRLEDAHLYCYQVGAEWFIDLRDPFGNIKSEYTYAIIVAVLKWAFECDRNIVSPGSGSALLGYVDNWFLLSPPDSASHDTCWQNLKAMFSLLGAPMHEEQDSRTGVVNALGWDWDLSAGIFSCPPDKYANCCRVVNEWATRAAADEFFTFIEIDSLAGLFQWVSAACPSIISSVVSLQSLKHNMKRTGAPTRKLDDRCKAAVADLASFFIAWDRKCMLFSGFSPVSSWEVLIKVDASTDFGSGGFCLPSFDCHIHMWSSEERACAMAHSTNAIRESTTFFELLGILLILTHFAPLLKGKRVQIECDNEAAIRDLVCCFSGKPMCMHVIARIRNLCAANHIIPRFEHILSAFNSIADRLSHDDLTQANTLCQSEFSRHLLPPLRR